MGMSDLVQRVNDLRRPRLLLKAVRHGLPEYRREQTLRQLLRLPVVPAPQRAAAILLQAEDEIDQARRQNDAAYSPARHVALLVALICEMRLMTGAAARGERDGAAIQLQSPMRLAVSAVAGAR